MGVVISAVVRKTRASQWFGVGGVVVYSSLLSILQRSCLFSVYLVLVQYCIGAVLYYLFSAIL